MDHNTFFITWLHNAHAMEENLIEVLEQHKDQAKGHPDVQDKISEHLEETKRHSKTVENILESLGEDTAIIKDTFQTVVGALAGISTAMAEDRIVKNAIADYAAEHMEIAVYNALITAAKEFGHTEIVPDLEGILRDEQAMARWLEDNLPSAVSEFVKSQSDSE